MTVHNTSGWSPEAHLLGAAAMGLDGYITGMEKQGQTLLVASELFPRDAPWEELQALGFVRGEDEASDDLFCSVTLPACWQREASDHDMWSYIVDERGVRRVGVFYKAAFYDRKASAYIQPVGETLASQAMYGDEPVALPDQWDVLTDDERAGFWVGVDRYLASHEKYPDSNVERATRVKALAELRSRKT